MNASDKEFINVVKIGGNVIDNPDALAAFLNDFRRLPGRKILVHGGGKEATRLSGEMGVVANMVDGRRCRGCSRSDAIPWV